MIGEICAEIKNYFCMKGDILIGDYSIQDGAIVPSVDILENQYFRIVGSVFNDGVHQNTTALELTDEPEFHGAIWLMRVPQDIIDLATEIEAWKDANAEAITSPYQSESFGGYSYSKASGTGGTGNAVGVDWRNQASFASRLNPYRRIRAL